MKNIEIIKQELLTFGKKHKASEEILNSIKGNTLIELFANIGKYIYWCRDSKEKTLEFNSIFGNDLVIEDDVLLCYCGKLTPIEIPPTVHTIGESAFAYCRKLTSIKLPNSITSIGDDAFYMCNPELEIIRKQ